MTVQQHAHSLISIAMGSLVSALLTVIPIIQNQPINRTLIIATIIVTLILAAAHAVTEILLQKLQGTGQ